MTTPKEYQDRFWQQHPTVAVREPADPPTSRWTDADEAFLCRMKDRDPANDETVEVSGYDYWRLIQLAEDGGS